MCGQLAQRGHVEDQGHVAVAENRGAGHAAQTAEHAAQGFDDGLVLAQQLVDTEAGVTLSTRIATDRLDKAHKARLKAALTAVDGALELVSEGRV